MASIKTLESIPGKDSANKIITRNQRKNSFWTLWICDRLTGDGAVVYIDLQVL